MNLAARGSLNFNLRSVSPKSFYPKGFPMKNFFQKHTKKLVAAGVAVYGTVASAALTAPTIATTDYETVAGAMLVGGAVMWAIRKALRLAGV